MDHIHLITLLLLAVLTVFISQYSKHKRDNPRLLAIEEGKQPLYSIICGATLSGKRYAFLRFAVYEDFIVIVNKKSIVLKSQDITGVRQGKPLFGSTKLSIDHKDSDCPSITLNLKDADTPKNIVQEMITKKNV